MKKKKKSVRQWDIYFQMILFHRTKKAKQGWHNMGKEIITGMSFLGELSLQDFKKIPN